MKFDDKEALQVAMLENVLDRKERPISKKKKK